ncbi:beta-glucosidase [Spirochaeta dissipatitropha]
MNDSNIKMSPNELADLSSGKTAWSSQGNEKLGITDITMNDGPHGVRKASGAADLHHSIPATAFPTTACTANSWDRDILRAVGAAIAVECRELGVQILLGPGLNIKRSPLGGRNFEYYSEDPVISGELAGAFIQGVQSMKVAATIKHLAANNAEFHRFTIDARLDERSLREIYLAAFERAVKVGKPWAVMAAYNKLNGEYCTQHKELLTDILRNEWGFDGIVMSDWAAVADRPAAVKAGLDLEMMGPSPHFDRILAEHIAEAAGVDTGTEIELNSPAVQISGVSRVISVFQKLTGRLAPVDPDALTRERITDSTAEEHHKIAREAAAAGMVLLKNENGLLPFLPDTVNKLAVIGKFADSPRFQGSGSSQINPTQVDTILSAARSVYSAVQYSEGYPENGIPTKQSIQDAVEKAASADRAILITGLTESYESEGFDRENIQLPEGQKELIEAVCKAQPNTAVIIIAGSAVDVSWRDNSQAILYAGLAGQAGGSALIDLVSGKLSPRGRLTESFPCRIEDTPCYTSFPGENNIAEYREGIFVGYRHYCSIGLKTAYPFGFGLTYTDFSYTSPKITSYTGDIDHESYYFVSVDITNTGGTAGTEVVQLYIAPPKGRLSRPVRELKNFSVVHLAPDETKTVELRLDARDFCAWDPTVQTFRAEPGQYLIQLGANAEEIRHSFSLQIKNGFGPQPRLDEWSNIVEWMKVPEANARLKELFPAEFYRMMNEGTRATDIMLQNVPLIKMVQFFPDRFKPEIVRKLAEDCS